MWAYLDTGMNLVDVDDVAVGHVRAMERGRIHYNCSRALHEIRLPQTPVATALEKAVR